MSAPSDAWYVRLPDGRILRACTHLDVSAADAERAAEVIRKTLRRPVAV